MISLPLHGSAGSTIATPGHRQRTAGISFRSAYSAASAHLSAPPCARHVAWIAFVSRPSPLRAHSGTQGHRSRERANRGNLVCTQGRLSSPRGSWPALSVWPGTRLRLNRSCPSGPTVGPRWRMHIHIGHGPPALVYRSLPLRASMTREHGAPTILALRQDD
jgi:hypothetical protein